MKLYENGAYLLNGKEVIIDGPKAQAAVKSKTGMDIDKQTAKQETIAYGILKEHNTSGNMDKLQIKFDKLTSHDITFVGIIQTARASGLARCSFVFLSSVANFTSVSFIERISA